MRRRSLAPSLLPPGEALTAGAIHPSSSSCLPILPNRRTPASEPHRRTPKPPAPRACSGLQQTDPAGPSGSPAGSLRNPTGSLGEDQTASSTPSEQTSRWLQTAHPLRPHSVIRSTRVAKACQGRPSATRGRIDLSSSTARRWPLRPYVSGSPSHQEAECQIHVPPSTPSRRERLPHRRSAVWRIATGSEALRID
jgi:hypothetical protein